MNKATKTLKNIGKSLFIIYVIFSFILVLKQPKYKQYYEYVDLDNNTGVASECSSYSGNLVCKLEDGTIKLVKECKLVNEKVESDE